MGFISAALAAECREITVQKRLLQVGVDGDVDAFPYGKVLLGVATGAANRLFVAATHLDALSAVSSELTGRAEGTDLEQPIAVNEGVEVEKPETCPLSSNDLVLPRLYSELGFVA